jgi:CubicO group peptidase (beta-lactamase class C family)
MSKLVVAVLAICAAALLPTAGQAQDAAFQKAWMESKLRIESDIGSRQIAGGSLYVLQRGEIIERAHFGLADVETERAVTADTIYHWASITKTFTHVAILQLQEQGRLSIDDPVVKYVPELRGVHNAFGEMEAVTLRQLMSHSAGFRESTWSWGGQSWHPYEPPGWAQLAAMMPYTQVEFAPGSRYGYSNLGTVLLGRTIEAVTGEDVEVYIDKNIFGPIGMTRSYFDLTPLWLQPVRSNNYNVRAGQRVANGPDFDTGITAANGGLNAPVGDMVLWLNFLAGVGDRANHDVVLSRAGLRTMFEPVFPTAESGAAWREYITTGFFAIDQTEPDGRTTRYIGHTGSQRGYLAFVYIDPVAQNGVVFAVNTRPETEPRTFVLDTRERLLSELLRRLR